MSDELVFAPEKRVSSEELSSWKVLIVDDDDDIHVITNNAIKNIIVHNKKLKIYNAKSAQEARDLLVEHKDFALALIDVVMETPIAGLDLVNYIRNDLKNRMIRLVIRTGQPNESPEQEVIEKYDINDYKEKTELSSRKLFTTIRTSIEQFNQLVELEEKYEETYTKMTTNSITGLPNRVKLNEYLDTDGEKSLIILNINGFSLINDSLGFESGNELLRKFSKFIKVTFSDLATVFHLEADHFILYSCKEQLTLIDDKFIESIRYTIQNNIFVIDEIETYVSVTLGLAVNETGNLIQKAELALKESKVFADGNTQEYSQSLQIVKTIEETLTWKKRLHDAILDNRIYSYYQPVKSLLDSSILKHEALVRLEYNGEIYKPEYFLDAAKASGQLFEIFKIMFINVCVQVESGKGKFSINVDKSDLLNPNILSFIEENMKKYGIGKNYITLEILENESFSKNKKLHSLLYTLKGLGLDISIDDFGTRCSNYSQVVDIPIDYIKIDGQFIKDIDTNIKSKIVTHTILDFSHQANIPVIAECVHSEKIKNIIKEMGINYGQGYYFSEPISKIK